jgi:hypothetical protein
MHPNRLLIVGGLIVLGACGPRRAPPAPGESRGAVPDLAGRTVMVLPVQQIEGLAGDGDAELAFALQTRLGDVEWVFPPALRRALQGSPALDVRLDALPVGVFLQAQVDRIGDPLFGAMIRLGALTGAGVALIPVAVRYRPGATGAAGVGEVVAVLLDVRTGYVAWFGVEAGQPGDASDPGVLASVLDALARRMAGGGGS